VISLAEAQQRIMALSTPLPAIEMPLHQSVGHYPAENILADRAQPAADLSAMDGYAIRFVDMPGPWWVTGESAAGAPFTGSLSAGEAVRIFTGAHVPMGADTILVQEDAHFEHSRLTMTGDGPDYSGKHIRLRASDFAENDCLLSAGDLLISGAVALAAMAGRGVVQVGGRPKVCIIATGDELVPPGAPCSPAQIPSSNTVMLAAMLNTLPCDVCDYGIVGDSLKALEQAFIANTDADIIVTTGGASVGDHDYVQEALMQSGANIDFWRIAMKPGKPVMAGKLGKTIVLGLPGNPSSAFVTAFLLLLPLIRHLAGCREPLPTSENAVLTTDISPTQNRVEFVLGRYERGEVTPLKGQDSGLVSTLAKANALIIRPIEAAAQRAGEDVAIYHLNL
jgi:molybdopterin molybdotransferase